MSIRILTWTRLTDGRPQLWAVTGEGKVVSTWQLEGTEGNPRWAQWADFSSPPGAIRTLTGVTLFDGRPQLFAVTTELGVFTLRKANTNPDAPWTNWEKFDTP